MDKMDRATSDLLDVFSTATQTAEKARGALMALGVDPVKAKSNGKAPAPAPARKPRTRKDNRPIPERALDAFRKTGEPTAAGAIARQLHVSPAQAKAAAEQLAAAGKLRVAGENRRQASLYVPVEA